MPWVAQPPPYAGGNWTELVFINPCFHQSSGPAGRPPLPLFSPTNRTSAAFSLTPDPSQS